MFVTPKQMLDIENLSEEQGVSKAALMENAGGAVCLFIMQEIYPNLDLSDGICILVGSGNNGGDGLAAAHCLAETGLPVHVLMTDGNPKTELAVGWYEKVKSTPEIHLLAGNIALSEIYQIIAGSPLIIDCIFGTGYDAKKPAPPHIQMLLDFVKKSSAVKIAVDIPSLADAFSGEYDIGINYSYTLSLGFDKIGVSQPPLSGFAGEIKTLDIGIPESALPETNAGIETLKWSAENIFTDRKPDSHKGDFGRVLIIAGSSRYSGAAHFAAAAAIRSGAGLVTLASTKEVCDRLASAIPELMYMPLPADKNGTIGISAVKELSSVIEKYDVVAFGCGIGESPAASDIAEMIIKGKTAVKIFDADGIKALLPIIELLSKSIGEIIITPHAGELAALYNTTIAEADKNRLQYARSFAFEHAVTVIAKGVPNVISDKNGGAKLLYAGNPGLSRGGSGDCLTGIIAGLAANRMTVFSAHAETADSLRLAIDAVGLHGAAADIAADKKTVHCMSVSDVINSIPEVIKGC
ncbi:MAG: NAD(P)H-hydrate dehydratase [Ruminococcus sp.]|jgi:NAD(P)H-hydrate epimerase|nr:NAD(P)H-hydrate dehydratase [Ruminococcus sp.]